MGCSIRMLSSGCEIHSSRGSMHLRESSSTCRVGECRELETGMPSYLAFGIYV